MIFLIYCVQRDLFEIALDSVVRAERQQQQSGLPNVRNNLQGRQRRRKKEGLKGQQLRLHYRMFVQG
jgi:hypothetical protein